MPGVSRADLQLVAEHKIGDANCLLAAGRFSNAFYLAGYAVEIGLKACIARQFTADAIPDKRFVNDIHVHDFSKLVGLAGLASELQREKDANIQFGANWATALGWTPEARYTHSDAATARSMVDAVADPMNGVLRWIRTAW